MMIREEVSLLIPNRPPDSPFYRGLHIQHTDQEPPLIRRLLNDLGRWLAGTMARFGFNSDQNRRGAGLRCLHGSGEFEAVTGPDTVVMIRSGNQSRWIVRARLDVVER